jgi:hypothetical protein
VTITNNGTLPLQFISTSIYATGTGFAQTNTCPATLAPGTSCIITPTFRPTIAGVRSGSISIVPKGAALATVLLTGTGR